MNIKNKTVLITGANRGIGKALVEEALRRGAKIVFAGMRTPAQHPDKRVIPLTLDVTNASQIQRAVGEVDALDVLINNAGVSPFDDLSDRRVLEQQFAVNLFGPYDVTQAFLPLLIRSRGSIVNVLSLSSLHRVVPGPVDTDMTRGLDIPKASPESVARAIWDGVEKGEEEIFPDPMSEAIAEGWRTGAVKALERQFSAYLPKSAANA